MRVGSQNHHLGNLLKYHATQRQQQFAQQFEGTRNFQDSLKRGADTFTRSAAHAEGAHHLRSNAHKLQGSTFDTPRGGLTPEQAERLKAKVGEEAGTAVNQNLAPATPESGDTQTSAPTTYTQGDIDALLKVFGSVQGDEAFDETMDMNADGKIDADDLNHMLSNLAQPEPAESEPVTYTQADVENLMKIFGSVAGDDAFDGSMDMNNDGKIDVDDLNHVLSNIEEPEEG